MQDGLKNIVNKKIGMEGVAAIIVVFKLSWMRNKTDGHQENQEREKKGSY